MNNTKEITKKYIDYFKTSETELYNLSEEVVNNHRKEAFQSFQKLGLPDKSIETYKYTDIAKAFDNDLGMAVDTPELGIDVEAIFKCDILKLDAHLALIAKGKFASKEPVQIEKGVIVCSFKEASKKYKSIFSKYYNQIAKEKEDGTIALNTALAFDGVFIYIPKNVVLQKPIQVVNIQVDGKFNNSIQVRNLVVLEEHSEAKIIFCDDSLTSNPHLTNTVTEVFVGKSSNLEISKMQNEHNASINIASTLIKQEEHSVASMHNISLLGGLIRNNVYMEMTGEHCEANAYGISLIDKKQNVDTLTYIHHAFPNCNSNQLFKNIIDDAGVGVFSGTVLVDRDAQKTNAFQSNNNIILTDTAKMNTKPQLIIYADDVKCSHGATVGQLDENALFYMRARGIEEKDAKMLLMYAFAAEVIKKMSIESLRENTEDLVRRRLSGEFSLCRNCSTRILKDSNI